MVKLGPLNDAPISVVKPNTANSAFTPIPTPINAIVQLIIDPDSAVAARLTSSGDTGLIVGERNQDLQMQLVRSDAKVFPSEQVVTAGYQGGLFPPEIIIGTVSHVYQQSGGLTKIVAVRPAVDFSSLETVLVLTGPKR